MNIASWIKYTGTAALIFLGAFPGHSQTTNAGNLAVQGDLDVQNSISFGALADAVINSPGVSLSYTDASQTVDFTAAQPAGVFAWQENGLSVANNKMVLDGSNNLTLFNTNGSEGISLDPNAGGIKLAGTNSGITFADGSVMTSLASLHSSALYDTLGNQSLNIDANGNLAISARSAVIGTNNTASDSYSVAFGGWSSASGGFSAAFGQSDTASGYASAVFGSWNNSSGDSSAAFGEETVASGNFSAAFGWQATASGWGSVAFGQKTVASNGGSVAFGKETVASGFLSTVFGWQAAASGDVSVAFGQQTSATGFAAVVVGVQNRANSYCSLALGQNDVGLCDGNGGQWTWFSTDPVVEIGNGVSGQPSDAMTIFKSGELRTEGAIQSKTGFRTPPTGDLSMGDYTTGINPATLDPTLGLKYQGE